MTETDLQRAIMSALRASGFWALRLNAGSMMVGEKGAQRRIRMAEPGTPDILVLKPYGFLEVKTAKGRIGMSQVRWHNKASEHGVRTAIVRSIGAALQTVKTWRDEDGLE